MFFDVVTRFWKDLPQAMRPRSLCDDWAPLTARLWAPCHRRGVQRRVSLILTASSRGDRIVLDILFPQTADDLARKVSSRNPLRRIMSVVDTAPETKSRQDARSAWGKARFCESEK